MTTYNNYLTKEEIDNGYEICKVGKEYVLFKYTPITENGDELYADIEYSSIKLRKVIKYLKEKRKGDR